jgi:hypothetical protein
MQKFFDTVLNSDGRPVAGASVTVTPVGGGSPSPLFSNAAGSTPKANPLTTDVNGYFDFYAADGRYSLSVSALGFTTRTVTDILLEDPADPSQQTINGGSINNTPIGGTTPSSGAFTTLSASGGISGDLTGNVTGNADTATSATTATTATNLAGGTVDATTVTSSGAMRTTSNAAPIGYNTGAGGAVTQETSKSTTVTLNRTTGIITMHNAALAGGASVSFALLNSSIASGDLVIAHPGGAVPASYTVNVLAVSSGAVSLRVTNVTGGSLSEAMTINFAVIKGASA